MVYGLRVLSSLIILLTFQLNAQTWKFYEQRSGRNVPMDIIETYDHGLVFTVFNSDLIQYYDINLYKLDVNGDVLWKRTYGLNQSFFETCGLLELTNGGYLLWGSVYAPDSGDEAGNPFILKLDMCFEPEWFKIYNEPESYNRIDHIIEYQGRLLVSFAYLNFNYITLALMDTAGNFLRKKTIPEIFTDDILIDRNETIMVLGCSGLFGLFNDPMKGIDKGFMIKLDSNLNVRSRYYLHEKDTSFPNLSFGMCFTDSLKYNFLTISSHRFPNPNNSDIDGSVMITKNFNDSDWYKIINDTSFYTSGKTIIKLNSNRFAISSYHSPDLKNPFLYYGKYYIIDSNANVISTANENPGTRSSGPRGMFNTHDSKLVTIGDYNRAGDDWDIFCYKYNENLSPFQKTGIQKNYDTLCNKTIISTSIQLMNPQIVNLLRDSFLSIYHASTAMDKQIKIYPNPGVRKVNISSQFEFKLAVFNHIGQRVSDFENVKEVNLPPGIYYFYFISGDIKLVRKVIIH